MKQMQRFHGELYKRFNGKGNPQANKKGGGFFVTEIADNLFIPLDKVHISEFEAVPVENPMSDFFAIHSSSVMTVNLFGNKKISFHNGIFSQNDFEIEYEKQYATVKPMSPQYKPACIDVMMTSKNEIGDKEIIFFEMKMKEWLESNVKENVKAYLDKKRYFYQDESYDAFHFMFERINRYIKAGEINVYDASQMCRHLLAIFNMACDYKNETGDTLAKTIRLINGIWEIDDPAIIGEEFEQDYRIKKALSNKEYLLFKESARLVIEQFAKMGITLRIDRMSVKQILDIIETHKLEREFKERYLF